MIEIETPASILGSSGVKESNFTNDLLSKLYPDGGPTFVTNVPPEFIYAVLPELSEFLPLMNLRSEPMSSDTYNMYEIMAAALGLPMVELQPRLKN